MAAVGTSLARGRHVASAAGDRLPPAARRLAHRRPATAVPLLAGAAAARHVGRHARPPVAVLAGLLRLALAVGRAIPARAPGGPAAAVRPVVIPPAALVLPAPGAVLLAVGGGPAAAGVAAVADDLDGFRSARRAVGVHVAPRRVS